MQVNDIWNKELSHHIIGVLRERFGVKQPKGKDKKQKIVQGKISSRRIFHTYLNCLEFADVFLANGSVVQIPKFVADACNRILEHVETEGIFRKAGSSLRQKEIRVSLEAGLPLGKSHHVVDVANLLKYFFRELNEPLISSMYQDTFLQCMSIDTNRVEAIMLTCLLLPPLTINTLAFFMQFLHTVSLNAHLNKMNVENLAIIFTPGLMPYPNMNTNRFNNHVKIIQILIENANLIGTIPSYIVKQFHQKNLNIINKSGKSFETEECLPKKRKKRRSDMFNGLKKIVGSALAGSTENLDTPLSNRLVPSCPQSTDLLKSIKKRKLLEPAGDYSAKKKKESRSIFPPNVEAIIPSCGMSKTPSSKESKKFRSSLGGGLSKANPVTAITTSMERRWSIVGSAWSKQKFKPKIQYTEDILTISTPNVLSSFNAEEHKKIDIECDAALKSEYEAIKDRVTAIEKRISQEFNTLQSANPSLTIEHSNGLSGPENVQNKYEEMIHETEALNTPRINYLTQRFKHDLNIRHSTDRGIIRSPSARRIGTIRRRSQRKSTLSRNPTWHINTNTNNSVNHKAFELNQPNAFYVKDIAAHRYRRNSFRETTPRNSHPPSSKCKDEEFFDCDRDEVDQHWTAGRDFFNLKDERENFVVHSEKEEKKISKTNNKFQEPQTPCESTRRLPPKSLRTPSSVFKMSSHLPFTPMQEDTHGRASIARLRSQNAGMVMAKAKLFNGLLEGCPSQNQSAAAATSINHNSRCNKTNGMNDDEFIFNCTPHRKESHRISRYRDGLHKSRPGSGSGKNIKKTSSNPL